MRMKEWTQQTQSVGENWASCGQIENEYDISKMGPTINIAGKIRPQMTKWKWLNLWWWKNGPNKQQSVGEIEHHEAKYKMNMILVKWAQLKLMLVN